HHGASAPLSPRLSAACVGAHQSPDRGDAGAGPAYGNAQASVGWFCAVGSARWRRACIACAVVEAVGRAGQAGVAGRAGISLRIVVGRGLAGAAGGDAVARWRRLAPGVRESCAMSAEQGHVTVLLAEA